MGFFNRKSDDNVKDEQRKFPDEIKNLCSGKLLICKHPEEIFSPKSTLTVMPGEKAIFIKDGTIEYVFDSGTYMLSTEKFPFIRKLINIITGGVSVLNCVVYFVRTAHSMEMRWGTDSPIQVRDKILGIATKLRCRGSYKICIEDPAMLLEKLIGNNVPFLTQDQLEDYFVYEFQSKIKSFISTAINESNAELLGIDSRLDEFSQLLKPYMQSILNNYGLSCVSFVVSAIDIDDNELRRRYDEIGMNAYEERRMENARTMSQRERLDVLGNDWGKQQSADILRDLANNPSVGAMAGSVFDNISNQMFEQASKNNVNSTPSQASGQSTEDPIETLSKLKRMLDAGLIEQSDYDAKKAEILQRI